MFVVPQPVAQQADTGTSDGEIAAQLRAQARLVLHCPSAGLGDSAYPGHSAYPLP
jgi:hypothetical protein